MLKMCASRNKLHNLSWVFTCVCAHIFYSAFQILIGRDSPPIRPNIDAQCACNHAWPIALRFSIKKKKKKNFDHILCALLYWNCSHTSVASHATNRKIHLISFPSQFLHLWITAPLWSFPRNTSGKLAGAEICLQTRLSISAAKCRNSHLQNWETVQWVICAFLSLRFSNPICHS